MQYNVGNADTYILKPSAICNYYMTVLYSINLNRECTNSILLNLKDFKYMLKYLFFTNKYFKDVSTVTADIDSCPFLELSFVLPTRCHKNVAQKPESYAFHFCFIPTKQKKNVCTVLHAPSSSSKICPSAPQNKNCPTNIAFVTWLATVTASVK